MIILHFYSCLISLKAINIIQFYSPGDMFIFILAQVQQWFFTYFSKPFVLNKESAFIILSIVT